MVYLDNAATSWPKPPAVAAAMAHFLGEVGANPGRAGHRLAVEAARIVYNAREAVAELFNAPDPLRVAFCANVTEAVNLALRGLLRPGDHVVTSGMEHNSVMRPLRALAANGVEVSAAACSPDGSLDPGEIERLIRPQTKIVALNHASNVTGTLLPIEEAGRICRARGPFLLVDAAQTAGAVPLDMEAAGIDLLAFTGHKSLYGPMGTGGLVIGERVDAGAIEPLKSGGTGSNSESDAHPDFLPDALEAGTPNAVGLSGLLAGITWLRERGIQTIHEHEQQLAGQLIAGLTSLPGVTVYGPRDARRRTAAVSFRIDHLSVAETGFRLDEEAGILCRVGLHCAPAAHNTIGTFPHGTVRFGIGAFNTAAEIDQALTAVYRLAKEGK